MADLTTTLLANGPAIIGAIVGGAVALLGAVTGVLKTLSFVRSVKDNAVAIAALGKRVTAIETARRTESIKARERKLVLDEHGDPASRPSLEDALTAHTVEQVTARVASLEAEMKLLGRSLNTIESHTKLLLDGKIRTP